MTKLPTQTNNNFKKNMKKQNKIVATLVLFASALTSFFGCSSAEYKGKPVEKIIYKTIDYLGGYTCVYVVDFDKNTYSACEFFPNDSNADTTPKQKNTFSDDQEKRFLNEVYKEGLFDLKPYYETKNVLDGGGWILTVVYTDGTEKTSEGSNLWPKKLKNCSAAFESLCGEKVL